MMKTIFKYKIAPCARKEPIVIPIDAEFLHVADQEGDICLWLLVDTNMSNQKYFLSVYGTGHEIEYINTKQYLGTVFQGPFVWHVFVEK